MKKMQKKWVERFSQQAQLLASWSKDPTTQVGAVIVNDRNQILSQGYNGLPMDARDDMLDDRDSKNRRTLHAEDNCILNANSPLEGSSIIITHPPCESCLSKLSQKGVKAIYYLSWVPSEEFYKRWDLDDCLEWASELKINIFSVEEDFFLRKMNVSFVHSE